jgi:hypothetical protein
MSGWEVGAMRAGCVVAAAACLAAVGLTGAGTAGAVDQQTMVGAWIGPATIGDVAGCANGSAEYAFSPNGTYRYAVLYDDCGAAMVDGHYELQGDGGVLQLSMELCSAPGCPDGPNTLTTPISSPDNETLIMGSYTYKRQHGST